MLHTLIENARKITIERLLVQKTKNHFVFLFVLSVIMSNSLSLQLRMPNGDTHDVKLIGKYDDLKNYGIDSSIIYSVWFEDDSPGGYFSFSSENQSWEYYGYLNADEQAQISNFLEDHGEIKWA
jgi:hypothetical protein